MNHGGRRIRALLPLACATVIATSGGLPVFAASAATAPRAPAIVLRYTFDGDQAGVVRDASTSGLNGTLVNASSPTAYVTGLPGYGKALSLVGSSHQYVKVPERPILDLDRFTVSALVRYTGIQNDTTNGRWEVLEKAGAYWINVRTDGKVRVGGFFGTCATAGWKHLDSVNPIPVNTWTQVAGTYDGTTLRVWVNGVVAASRPITGRTCSTNEPLAVGAKEAPSHGLLEAFWDGRLDAIRVYNRALTASEMAALVPA